MHIIESAKKIHKILTTKYPTPKSALNWSTPWQMLIATILSAQTTDIMVNKVTEKLFLEYPEPINMRHASFENIYTIIRPVNYSRTKTNNLLYNAKIIVEQYNNNIPNSINELIKLKGVGRKVANVIMGEVFQIPEGIVVDTHVKRVAYRLGFTKNTNPSKIEHDLTKIFPKSEWINISHRLIFHGREICRAKKPQCDICPIKKYCQYYKTLV